MKDKALGLALLAAVLFFAAARPIQANELSAWFSEKQSKPYSDIKVELERVYDETVALGVNGYLIVDRLREGAIKKVPSSALLKAIREDCLRFIAMLTIYKNLPIAPSIKPDSDYFLKSGAIILRSNVPNKVVSSLFSDMAFEFGARRVMDSLLATAAVRTRFTLTDAEMETLTKALVRSTEKTEKFVQLSALFVRGVSGGLRPSEIASIAASTLDRGGAIFQIDTEIFRRIR